MEENKGRLENTSLLSDIDSVAAAVHNHTKWIHISATLHTKEEDVGVVKVYLRQDVKKYAEDTSGFGNVTLIIGRGDFMYRIFPRRDHLEMSITTKFIFSSGKEDEKRRRVERFKCVYRDDVNPSPQMDNDANRTIEDLNQQGHVELSMEIQELWEEVYRMITMDGTYANILSLDLLEAGCTHRLNMIRLEGKPILEAFHVEPPHNTDPYKTLLIPRGMLVRNLPGWLQELGHGVYNAGIGNFIDRFKDLVTWFVYPLFDYKKRFDEDVEKLVIYFAPEDRYGGVENTYRKEGKVTYIITTSTPPVSTTGFNDELNRGVGFRLTSSKAIMTKPANIRPTDVYADYTKANSEVVSRDREDQANFARSVGSNHNQYIQMSRILKNMAAFVDITWNHADMDTIYPAMPVKCIFMHQGEYEEKYGSVMSTLGVGRMVGNPMTSEYHKFDMELKIAMEPVTYKPPKQKGGFFGDS